MIKCVCKKTDTFFMGDFMDKQDIFFTCETNLDWDTYKQLNLINYKKAVKYSLTSIILLTLVSAAAFIFNFLSAAYCCLLFLFVFLLIFINIKYKKNCELEQGRQKVSFGKDVVDRKYVFSNKIYVTSSCDLERSFEYALVERLYETKESYILVLSHNMAMVINKIDLKGTEGLDFKKFILDKCYEVKKRKFIKIDKSQKNFTRLTVLAFFISVVVLMLFFFKKTPENWRELGRNPQYSSSQQGTTQDSSK